MRFARSLRHLARLPAPPHGRLRIVEEVGADLEALYGELRRRGVPEAEARARAERLLLPGAAAAAALTDLHRPVWGRWWERYIDVAASHERMLLMGLLGMCAGLGLGALVRSTLVSPMAVPLAWLGLVPVLLAVKRALQIWAGGLCSPTEIRGGSGVLLVIAAVALLLAGAGSLFELAGLASAAAAHPARQVPLVLGWLRATVQLLLLGLTVASVSGLLWLATVQLAAYVDQREREVLGPLLKTLPPTERSPS